MADGSGAQAVRRRRGPRVLLAGLGVMVVLAVIGVEVNRWWTGRPDEIRHYTSVPDSAGSAKGQAGRLIEALRPHGLTCSDQYLDDSAGYSRGCYRTDFEHEVAVEFAGPPDGRLGRISIKVNYIGAAAGEMRGDFDGLVAEVVRAASLDSADAAGVTKHLAAGTDQNFSLRWGTADLDGFNIRLLHKGWTPAGITPDALPGSIEALNRFAVQRGYSCKANASSLVCHKKADGAKLSLIAAKDRDTTRIAQLHVSADTGRKDRAMEVALAEQAAALDILGGPRAATAKVWFGDNASVAGGRAYVIGMHASIKVHAVVHLVQLDLNAPANDRVSWRR